MENLILYSCARSIATVTLNRPEKANALAKNMRRDLAERLEEAGRDDRIRVVIIKGAGSNFCAGGDMHLVREMMNERTGADQFARTLGAARRVVTAIRTMQKPVIASINGMAAGSGFNLALACDLRVAAESARFTQAFTRYGLHPEWGGTFFLPRIVAPNIAMEMFLLGDTIDAQQAFTFGILNRVVADEELESATQRLAERLCELPASAVASIKHAVNMSASGASLEQMMLFESEAQRRCFATDEARAGVTAFVEKRQPRFHQK